MLHALLCVYNTLRRDLLRERLSVLIPLYMIHCILFFSKTKTTWTYLFPVYLGLNLWFKLPRLGSPPWAKPGREACSKKKTCKVQRRGLVLCLSWGRGSWGPWCADLCLQKLSLGTWIVCALVGKKPQVVQEVEKVAKVTSLSAECFNVGVFSERTGGLTLCDWVFWRGRLELLFMLEQQTAVQSTVSDHGAFGWGSEGDAAWGLITRLFLIIGWFIQQHLRPEISDWLWCYRVCRECAQLCIFIYPWVADCLFLQASVGKSPS